MGESGSNSLHCAFMKDGYMKIALSGVSNMSVATLGRNPTFEFYMSYAFRTQ